MVFSVRRLPRQADEARHGAEPAEEGERIGDFGGWNGVGASGRAFRA